MDLHKGHRQRLKERFLNEGFDSFSNHNILELLLFYSIPQRDTNELAHELINRFGSLSGVFDAPYEELVQVKGISSHSALLMSMLPQLCQRYLTDKNTEVILDSTEKAGHYLTRFYIGRKNEEVTILCLDGKCGLVGRFVLHEGSINSAEVSTRKVLKAALSSNAVGVILAHNHPGGIALPSAEDISTTKKIQQALASADIPLVDHIIVAGEDFVSMASSGMLK